MSHRVIRHVIQNIVMGIPPVYRLAMRFHSTGLNRDPVAVKAAYSFYREHTEVAAKAILELGPGQTLEVLELARQDGAERCTGLDILNYDETDDLADQGIELDVYDGRSFPYSNESFDVVWCSDVLEHFRFPETALSEVIRVLKPGGAFITRVDLRDHHFLDDPLKWYTCLRYSDRLWKAMTWNRSSYVNRLRYSQWQRLMKKAGFVNLEYFPHIRPESLEQWRQQQYLERLSDEDLLTFRFDMVATKPNHS